MSKYLNYLNRTHGIIADILLLLILCCGSKFHFGIHKGLMFDFGHHQAA